jgi:hypothetical protein
LLATDDLTGGKVERIVEAQHRPFDVPVRRIRGVARQRARRRGGDQLGNGRDAEVADALRWRGAQFAPAFVRERHARRGAGTRVVSNAANASGAADAHRQRVMHVEQIGQRTVHRARRSAQSAPKNVHVLRRQPDVRQR